MRWLSPQLERVILAAIVVVSVAVALVWLVRVPPFQQPDEDVHADYALSILSSGRLLHAADGTPAIDVHPLIPYLKNATGFRSMLYNVDGRVPDGYGTRAFEERLADGTPVVQRDFIARSGHVPAILLSYPYLYYAADALAMRVGSILTGQSGPSLLYFGRGFSLLLLACSLVLTYGVFCAMRLPQALRLAALATIGLFPLTSWVSAYIQPDNLAFTAVMLVVYLTVRLDDELRPRALAILGCALGVLWLTKLQYFVAASLPALLAVLGIALMRKRPARFWLVAALALGVPLALAIASQGFVGTGAAHATRTYLGSYVHPWQRAIAESQNAPAFLLNAVWAGYLAVFVRGLLFLSYWRNFAYFSPQIALGPAALTGEVNTLLGWASAVVGLLLVVREVRVIPRLIRVAIAGRRRAALRLFSSAVVLNTYLLFCAVMLGIVILSVGRIGGWGRSWMPLQAGAVLCAVWYAPQALPRRAKLAMRRVVAASLLAYSCTGAVAGLIALNERYYAAPEQPSLSENFVRVASVEKHGERVVVRGVALDSRSGLPAVRVDLVVDGSQHIRAAAGLPSPALVNELHDPGLADSGFEGSVDLRGLAPGHHTGSFLVYERTRQAPYPSYVPFEFDAP